MDIKIKHLYPDFLNLYGDKGNIAVLKTRCEKRNINVTVYEMTKDNFSLDDCDILLLGGGYEREQKFVLNELKAFKDDIKDYIENGKVMLALCGGFEMLGSYESSDEGLEILNISTAFKEKRLMGDIVIECGTENEKYDVVGFENHAGRVDIKDYTPFGRVKHGFGNDDCKGFEGLVYKNLFATHLHGPLLPKNPVLADLIISKALKNKYESFEQLEPLDDSFEQEAHNNIVLKLKKE
ncbi:MAG: glutamine amidotransferase [Clostridia bacterium]|nr:glutamine amidotransferase [Clostridia bacterium]